MIKLKKLKRCLVIGIVTITTMLSMTITASAATTINSTDKQVLNSNFATGNEHKYTSVKTDGSTQEVYLFKVSGNTITFNADEFERMEADEQKRAMSDLSEWLSDAQMTNESKQAIQEEVRKSSSKAGNMMIPVIFEGTQADLLSAYKIFQPFQGPLGIVLGIGVIVITVLLMASTVMDLVYIGVPVARNYLTVKTEERTGNSMNKPWGITNDAFSAINETEATLQGGDGKYKNAYTIYFKRRAFTYIILAICILYLLSGQIVGIISWLLNLVSGFGS